MKNVLITSLLVITSLFLLFLLAEGAVSLARGSNPGTSLGYGLYRLVRGDTWQQGLQSADDPNARILSDVSEIEGLMDQLQADGVGLGNTPFHELKTDESSLYIDTGGCKRQKPDLRKRQTHLITRLYDPFDPILAFWNEDQVLHPDVRRFIDRYEFHEATLTTNAYGDRVTLPVVQSERKVIVGGDSVANGVLLNDRETIASQLQQLDPERQYINTGINGATAGEVICGIETAVRNYGGQFEELIYVYSENDFDSGTPFGTPEEVVAWLKAFAAKQGLRRTTVVYSPYIYNIVPQLTRFRGYRGDRFPHHNAEKLRLEAAAETAGIGFIDYTDIALAENQAAGTMFAALALFVDHAHYSRYGTAKLVARLRGE